MTEQQTTQLVKSDGFSAIETRQNAETAAIAMSAKVRAGIEAACVMAERHPRNWLTTRAKLLDECKRPGFCDSAIYSLPRGGATITGFSIRFAEAALRYMTNMSAGSEVVYEDDEKQLVTVTVRDYESNTSIEVSINVPKRVEKKKLKSGERPLSSRVNSYGDTVYLLPATDDEIAMKHNSLVSKAIRNAVLRMLPGDIADECESAIAKTKNSRDAKDPMAETKRVVDAFAEIRVMPESLEEYVGHSLETLSPKELDELRGVRLAIRDGIISWVEALETKTGALGESSEKDANRNATVVSALNKAREKLDSRNGSKQRTSSDSREPGQEG